MVNNSEFATKPGKRILKSETGKRVSRDAAECFVEELEEEGVEIAEKAKEFAESAGRKTVRAEDIKRAIRVSDRK